MSEDRRTGGVLMELRNITLRFGGVVAVRDVSFDIREGGIRATLNIQDANVAGEQPRMAAE